MKFRDENKILRNIAQLIKSFIILYNTDNLYWSTVFHSSSAILYCYLFLISTGFNTENPDETIEIPLNNKSALCTIWNLMFQTLFIFLALVYDMLEWMNAHKGAKATKIKYFRDVVFSALVVPFTCFVCFMFWSIYAVDRELVFPKAFDDIMPWWFNHCVHTNILVILIVETILTPRRFPVDRRLELWLCVGFYVAYAVVYYSIYAFSGRWLYNVFGIMTWWQIVLFQSTIFLFGFVYYFAQFPINRLIHKEPVVPDKVHSSEDQVTRQESKLRTSSHYERTDL